MKENNLRAIYFDKNLLDSSTIVTDNINNNDLDFNNIIGMHLLPNYGVNYLRDKKKSDYIEYLDKFMLENFDLFFYSDIEHGRLYFEFIMGSKSDVDKKYLIKKLICQIEEDSCPSCSTKLIIKLLESKPTKIDGETKTCAKFVIYCPKCDGIFGEYGFKATHMVKSLFFDTKKFLTSIESVNFELIKLGSGIKLKSNIDAIHKC